MSVFYWCHSANMCYRTILFRRTDHIHRWLWGHKQPVRTESTGHFPCDYRGRTFSDSGGVGFGEGSPKNPHQLPMVCVFSSVQGLSRIRLLVTPWIAARRAPLYVFSRVQLFETPWTVACQAPLSVEFSRQEYWIRLPFPSPVDLPNIGIELVSPKSPPLAGGPFTTEAPGKSQTLPRQCLNFQVWSAQHQLKMGAVT